MVSIESFVFRSNQSILVLVLRRNTRPVNNESFDSESTTTLSSKRRYLFTDDQRRALKQTFENEPYPSQARLEQLVDELSLPMNKISNWFHNARMRTKSNIQPIDPVKASASTRTDDNNNNNEDDEEDDDDDDHALSIAPLNNSWFNDSDSVRSPVNVTANLLSTPDEQKFIPTPPSSSSKKRKSVPQKIISTKKVNLENGDPNEIANIDT